jgi:hypothetical protein
LGGFGVENFFVKDNRFYEQRLYFTVPRKDKLLSITFETFRDKVEPGSSEKWKIKISGEKAEATVAETLLSMYDASLDQFQNYQWLIPSFWPRYFGLSANLGIQRKFFNNRCLSENLE